MTQNIISAALRNLMKRKLSTVLSAALLVGIGSCPGSARAATAAFDLKNTSSQTTLNEIAVITGGGTFDPVSTTVEANGTFTILNAFDEVPSGIMSGTWTATDFISFTSSRGKRVLHVKVTMDFDLGFSLPGIEFIITESGVLLPNLANEQFIIPIEGHTVFHMSGSAG